MELEELRRRLMRRSKAATPPPVENPIAVEDAPAAAPPPTEPVAGAEPAQIADAPSEQQPDSAASVDQSPQGADSSVRQADAAPGEFWSQIASASVQAPLEVAGAARAASPAPPVISGQESAQNISLLSQAVDQLFEPTQSFRNHFLELGQLIDPLEAAHRSTSEAYERIAGLYEHLESLGTAFQSVKGFAEQVGELSNTFAPMQALHTQLDQLVNAFHQNVTGLAASLEPAKTLAGKIRALGDALESISLLEDQLTELARVFRPAGADKEAAAESSASNKETARAPLANGAQSHEMATQPTA